jgi:hypothetical protein
MIGIPYPSAKDGIRKRARARRRARRGPAVESPLASKTCYGSARAAIEKVDSRLALPAAPADDDERGRVRSEPAGEFAPDLKKQEVVFRASMVEQITK